MEYNYVGKIITTHGLKGELKIKSESSFINERFKEGSTLYILNKGEYQKMTVASHRSMNGYELVSFLGYDDVDKAQFLRNKDLYGEKDRSILKEGMHFYSDYPGMKVSQYNKIVGEVKEILSFPQADYLSVENDKNEVRLVPILDEFILDVKDNIIYVVDMEGLLYD